MNCNLDPKHDMGFQDFFTWRSQALAAASSALTDDDDDEDPADLDEPPEPQPTLSSTITDFHKSAVKPPNARTESLLTKAFHAPDTESEPIIKDQLPRSNDPSRRKSMISNASLASTAELTSDGGLTSPARTNTPSPPPPNAMYSQLAPYSFNSRKMHAPISLDANINIEAVKLGEAAVVAVDTEHNIVEPALRKRSIQFACDARKNMAEVKAAPPVTLPAQRPTTPPADVVVPKRKCMIRFACPGPKASGKKVEKEAHPAGTDIVEKGIQPESMGAPTVAKLENHKRLTSRSPSLSRRSPRASQPSRHRDSTGTVRRASQSPVALRLKPKFIIADEQTLRKSEATRFHEFASEEVEEDDWITKASDVPKEKLTINDTLKLENAIRKLGNEAEQEMEEDEEEDDDGDDFAEDDDDDDDDDDENASSGNETDNEAGFADSDDSEGEDEFTFWTPGQRIVLPASNEAHTLRSSFQRAASASSIDSLDHMEIEGRRPRRRPIKIRPGTPELPDSTDFVCGTLDEDRPLEEAYMSCKKLKTNAKHKQTPQDIDPSFPTSDIEKEDENDHVKASYDTEENVWIHGKFEESDDERQSRHRSNAPRRKSPKQSPRRLHSPPPAAGRKLHSPPPQKPRCRSPPPRKLFGHSPGRTRSPPPPRVMFSPPATPTGPTAPRAIEFATNFESRPGLTHTKSLPRTPNAFCRQYAASRLVAANGTATDFDNDGHVRGAIDIVKGLEHRRARRKEKFFQKHCQRRNKGHGERRPQPGKGAERMRELGLLMAGKTGDKDPYMMSA